MAVEFTDENFQSEVLESDKLVMVDFWANHFSVDSRKGMIGPVLPHYLNRAIVPHALGRFEELLQANARSSAMPGTCTAVRFPQNSPPGWETRGIYPGAAEGGAARRSRWR